MSEPGVAAQGDPPKADPDSIDNELARFEAEMAELTTPPPPPPPAPLPPPKATAGKPRPPLPPPPPAGAAKTPPLNGAPPIRPPPPRPPVISGAPTITPPPTISGNPTITSPPMPRPPFPGAPPRPPGAVPGPPPAGFRPPPPPPSQWGAPAPFPTQPLYGPALPPQAVSPLPAPQPAFYPPGPSGQFVQPAPYPPALAQYPGPSQTPPPTQGQTLFERDMKALDPAELERVKAALAGEEVKPDPKKETKKRPIARTAAGEKWVDPTLTEWPENDFRIFCGNLGNEVNEDVLSKAFVKYSSFNMGKVIRDKRTGKTRGYGFVSFATQGDMFSALKEMQGKYVGNRPLILRKSSWEERTDMQAQKAQKKYKKQKSNHVG